VVLATQEEEEEEEVYIVMHSTCVKYR